MVIGECVRRAAHLQSVAGAGQILCSLDLLEKGVLKVDYKKFDVISIERFEAVEIVGMS